MPSGLSSIDLVWDQEVTLSLLAPAIGYPIWADPPSPQFPIKRTQEFVFIDSSLLDNK